MISAWLDWIAYLLLLFGLSAMTIALIGMWRLPGLRLRLHAASLVGIMGVIPLLLASVAVNEAAFFGRCLLIVVVLVLTMPATIHVLARASYQRDRGDWKNPERDQAL